MEWLTELLGVGATAASGGLFGLLGSVVGVFVRSKQEKDRRTWEQQKHTLRIELMQKQAELAVQHANIQGSWSNLEASVAADAAVQPQSGWAKDVKALFRPFCTVMLWVLSVVVFVLLVRSIGGRGPELLQGVFDRGWLQDLIRYMVYSLFFSATTATVWWFGDRALTPPGMK